MKLYREDEVEVIKSSNDLETSQASITMTPQMFQLLSSGIYTHKVRAVIRELSCNCVDAHAMNGNESRPFNAHLPSHLEPYFEVRDFGPGMSHEQIMKLYLSYGSSTKRDSNTQIGGFGIGSKSPFAIAQSFTVTAFQHGVKRQYSIYMENGIPQVTKLLEIQTNEEDGMAVRVAVSTDKINEFKDEAGKVYAHFPVRPNLNADIQFLYDDDVVLAEELDKYKVFMSKNRGYGDFPVSIIMGNIEYPIRFADLGLGVNGTLPPAMSQMIGRMLVYVPIGSVQVTASREALQLNDATIEAVRSCFDGLAEKMSGYIQEQLDKCEDYLELAKYVRATFQGHATAMTLLSKLTYKGEVINSIMAKQLYCRSEQAKDDNGDLLFAKDGTTLLMRNCVAPVPCVTTYEWKRGTPNQRMTKYNVNSEDNFNLFKLTSDRLEYFENNILWIISDRRNKNGSVKTTGENQIMHGLFLKVHTEKLTSWHHMKAYFFDSEAELDAHIALHKYPKAKMQIFKMSEHESFYVPKKVTRGEVKLLVADDGFPTELKVNLDEIEDTQYYLKTAGHVVENEQFAESMGEVSRVASKILGKPVYVFRKATWGKIPEEWVELTPEILFEAMGPEDWKEDNYLAIRRAPQVCGPGRENKTVCLLKVGDTLRGDGWFYKSDAAVTINLAKNLHVIDKFYTRPAYWLAKYVHIGLTERVNSLFVLLAPKSPVKKEILKRRKRMDKKVRAASQKRYVEHVLVRNISWSHLNMMDLLTHLGVPFVGVDEEDMTKAY